MNIEEKSHYLSSPFLYHFTSKFDTLKLILKNGFRFSRNTENIKENYYQSLFLISFCDIRFNDSVKHRECYGNYSIGLKKDWGIKNGVSPVRYVHGNSLGSTEEYLKIKDFFRAFKKYKYKQNKDYIEHLLFTYFSIINHKNETTSSNVNLSKPEQFEKIIERMNKDFLKLYSTMSQQSEAWAMILSKMLEIQYFWINQLYSELLVRDWYVRKYQEEFKCPKNSEIANEKVLYEEREWRAIVNYKYEGKEENERIKEIQEYAIQGYLPEKYNLKFDIQDIVVITVESETEKGELLEFFKKENLFSEKNSVFENLIIPYSTYHE